MSGLLHVLAVRPPLRLRFCPFIRAKPVLRQRTKPLQFWRHSCPPSSRIAGLRGRAHMSMEKIEALLSQIDEALELATELECATTIQLLLMAHLDLRQHALSRRRQISE
jgi:hypothetical protein